MFSRCPSKVHPKQAISARTLEEDVLTPFLTGPGTASQKRQENRVNAPEYEPGLNGLAQRNHSEKRPPSQQESTSMTVENIRQRSSEKELFEFVVSGKYADLKD